MIFKEMTLTHSLSQAETFTALCLPSHKSQRNVKHSLLSNVCLSFLLIVGGGSGASVGFMKVKAKEGHSLGELVRWAYGLV